MILMATLGSAFPKIWESSNPNKTAYFSTRFGEQRTSWEEILKNFPVNTGRAAIGRYIKYLSCGPTQEYGSSILLVESIRYLRMPKIILNKRYDIEVSFSFVKKVRDASIRTAINGLKKFPLMQLVRHRMIDMFLTHEIY